MKTSVLDIDAEIRSLMSRRTKLIKLKKLRLEVAALEGRFSQPQDVQRLAEIVSKDRAVPISSLFSSIRTRSISDARFVVFFLLRRHTKLSLAEIGSMFSRDHGTILHGYTQAEVLVKQNPAFKESVERCEAEFLKVKL
jgi:chromosomal replication initiator protein